MNFISTARYLWARLVTAAKGTHKPRPVRSWGTPRLVDDRALEVYVWILAHPGRKHIVATRLLRTQAIFLALQDRGIDIEVYAAARIATGIQWNEPNMALSCTYFIQDLPLYENLRMRLRGPDPLYNVAAWSERLRQGLR